MGIRRRLVRLLLLNTIVGNNVIKEEVVVSLPEKFGRNFSTMSVKLTYLNNGKFDCIIGVNILRPLGVKIDFQNEVIIVNNDEIEVNNSNLNVSYGDYLERIDVCKLDDLIPVDLNAEESKLLRKFLYEKKRTFYIEGQNLTTTDCIRHKIVTTSYRPIYCRNYKYPQNLENEIKNK